MCSVVKKGINATVQMRWLVLFLRFFELTNEKGSSTSRFALA